MRWYRKIATVISVLILALSLSGCISENDNTVEDGHYDNQIMNLENDDQGNKENKQDKEADREKVIKSLEDEYRPILESGKKYEDMTAEEEELAGKMINDWLKLSRDYRVKYSSARNGIALSKSDYDSKKQAEENAKREVEERASYNTGVTYDQLVRMPEDYKDEKVKFSGRVMQVLQDSNEIDIRLAVNGDENRVLIAAYETDTLNPHIVKNDYLVIRGRAGGIITYQSFFGLFASAPLVLVDKIELKN